MVNLHRKLVPSPWCGLMLNSIQWSRPAGDLDQHQRPAYFCSGPISGGSPRNPPSLFLPSCTCVSCIGFFLSYNSFLWKTCPKNNVTFGFQLRTDWRYLNIILIKKNENMVFYELLHQLKNMLVKECLSWFKKYKTRWGIDWEFEIDLSI